MLRLSKPHAFKMLAYFVKSSDHFLRKCVRPTRLASSVSCFKCTQHLSVFDVDYCKANVGSLCSMNSLTDIPPQIDIMPRTGHLTNSTSPTLQRCACRRNWGFFTWQRKKIIETSNVKRYAGCFTQWKSKDRPWSNSSKGSKPKGLDLFQSSQRSKIDEHIIHTLMKNVLANPSTSGRGNKR